MGVSITTVNAIRGLGLDIAHLSEQRLFRMPDDEIAAKARAEDRIAITFDLDFGDIVAASRGVSPSVSLIRTRNQTPAAVSLRSGAFITIEDSGYRLRQLPIR
jgi:predicted nuclease of predicted toxin-antitoxin system